MFPADFISGSRDFTQHLTSGELMHSVDACILVYIARACSEKPFRASLNEIETFTHLKVEILIKNNGPSEGRLATFLRVVLCSQASTLYSKYQYLSD